MGWLHYGISCQWLHGHGYIQYCDMRGIMALCMAKLMRGTESMAEGEARLSRRRPAQAHICNMGFPADKSHTVCHSPSL